MAECGSCPSNRDNNSVNSDYDKTGDNAEEGSDEVLDSLERAQEEAKNKGMGSLHEFLQDKLDSWKKTPVNIAVIGNSKAGKSCFINGMRDLKDDDEGAADVGHTETTHDIKPYPYPKHSNIVFWDLPGIGTPSFKRDEYVGIINRQLLEKGYVVNGLESIASFDFYLLLSKDTFTENDAWLAKKVENEYKKKYFFVRTNIDCSIQSEKKGKRNPKKGSTVQNEIRENCKAALQREGLICDTIYLVDSTAPETFDFESLKTDLIIRAPQAKADTLTFSIISLSEKVIEQKKRQLSSRVQYKVLIYMFGSMDKEVDFYREQFGLTDDALCQTASLLGKSKDDLCLELDLQSPSIEDNPTYRLIIFFSSSCVQLGLSRVSSDETNMLRNFLATGTNMHMILTVYKFLSQSLELCAADALKIQKCVFTYLNKS